MESRDKETNDSTGRSSAEILIDIDGLRFSTMPSRKMELAVRLKFENRRSLDCNGRSAMLDKAIKRPFLD